MSPRVAAIMIFHLLTVSLVCLYRRSSMSLLPAFLVPTHGALSGAVGHDRRRAGQVPRSAGEFCRAYDEVRYFVRSDPESISTSPPPIAGSTSFAAPQRF
jgi:hypothetical protein